jgi:hypothetical protein
MVQAHLYHPPRHCPVANLQRFLAQEGVARWWCTTASAQTVFTLEPPLRRLKWSEPQSAGAGDTRSSVVQMAVQG